MIVIRTEIYFAWWLAPYLEALMFFAMLCAAEPDPEKLGRVMKAAMRFRRVVAVAPPYGEAVPE